jgi:multiple sugar transport system permease protein
MSVATSAVATKPLRKRFNAGALPWIGPAIAVIVLMVLYPAYTMIKTSFMNIDETGTSHGFTGLSNYRTLFHNPNLVPVLERTLIWTVSVVFFTVIISLPVAQVLHAKFPGRRLVRYALIVPWAASVVMTSTSWLWILNGYYGVLNRIMLSLGLIKDQVQFLGSPTQSFAWLILVAVFVSVPFTTYVILAGLTTVGEDIMEASTVDGASGWQRYKHITFPLLRPALLISMVINLINVFNSFPIIWVMTTGGPGYSTDTTTTLAYKITFRSADIGQSASMATINFAIILVFIALFLKVSRWKEND